MIEQAQYQVLFRRLKGMADRLNLELGWGDDRGYYFASTPIYQQRIRIMRYADCRADITFDPERDRWKLQYWDDYNGEWFIDNDLIKRVKEIVEEDKQVWELVQRGPVK